jgi:RNase P/RNase MRP subunit p29
MGRKDIIAELLKTVWVGKKVKVYNKNKQNKAKQDKTKIKKPQKALIGIVMDETKNTIKIKTNNKIITVLKQNTIFEINIKNNTFIVDGSKLISRIEKRIKNL